MFFLCKIVQHGYDHQQLFSGTSSATCKIVHVFIQIISKLNANVVLAIICKKTVEDVKVCKKVTTTSLPFSDEDVSNSNVSKAKHFKLKVPLQMYTEIPDLVVF